jgi:hypothetical protein
MKNKIRKDIGEEVIEKLAEFLDTVKKKLQEKENEKECTSTYSC